MKKTKKTVQKELNVAFFGTSDRSIPILEALKQSFNLVLCVTKKDTKVGRDQTIRETSVKKWALENNIKCTTIKSLKDHDLDQVIEQILLLKVDYGIVADFSMIIPTPLINVFEGKRLINIHFSLLPKYRGASPVQHAIINGDDLTGITYLLVSNDVDRGDILFQIGYKMSSTETSGFLYKTLFELAANNISKVIQEYDLGKIIPIVQDESKASYTYSPTHPVSTFIFKEDASINWKENVNLIERKIRAYNPWPICWTTLKSLQNNKKIQKKVKIKPHLDLNTKVKIYEALLTENDILEINKLQPEGKKLLTWNDFENGYTQKIKKLIKTKEIKKEGEEVLEIPAAHPGINLPLS